MLRKFCNDVASRAQTNPSLWKPAESFKSKTIKPIMHAKRKYISRSQLNLFMSKKGGKIMTKNDIFHRKFSINRFLSANLTFIVFPFFTQAFLFSD